MGKGKPLSSSAALLAALLLCGQTIAFADKGGKRPGNPASPHINLGLGAVPKVGVGLVSPSVAAAAAISVPKTVPAVGSSGPGSSGAPGLASSVGVGLPSSSIPAAGAISVPITVPAAGSSGSGSLGSSGPGSSSSSGKGSSGSSGSGSSGSSGHSGGQGQGNRQGSDDPPQSEIVAQAQSSEPSQARIDRLPTCR